MMRRVPIENTEANCSQVVGEVVSDVFDSMDKEDAEGVAPGVAEGSDVFVGAMNQLVHVKQKQLKLETRANLEVERLKSELERREVAHSDYLIRLKQAQRQQVQELVETAKSERQKFEEATLALRIHAENREAELQDELCRTRRRSDQRARLLTERMARKDASVAAEVAGGKAAFDRMSKSFEGELARRRKEIASHEEKYNNDTKQLRLENEKLKAQVERQKTQITGLSDDLGIFQKAFYAMERSKEQGLEAMLEERKENARTRASVEPTVETTLPQDTFGQTEPEIEPGDADPETRIEEEQYLVEEKRQIEQTQHPAAYMDMLAQLLATQAQLDRTRLQCTKQMALLRELRHTPGSEATIILQSQVDALEAQLSEKHNATAVNIGRKEKPYQLSRFAPRTMRGSDVPNRKSEVPTLPPVK